MKGCRDDNFFFQYFHFSPVQSGYTTQKYVIMTSKLRRDVLTSQWRYYCVVALGSDDIIIVTVSI